ncbi:MAG: hypothetical protein AAF501_07520, partial [Pseudomonadota bacterium]
SAHPDDHPKQAETAPILEAIVDDRSGSGHLIERLEIGPDILDPDIHGLELRNWLTFAVGAPPRGIAGPAPS